MKTDIYKKNKTALGVLCALCCLSVAVMLFIIIMTNNIEAFTPPEFDKEAITGTPEVPENLGYSPLEIESGFSTFICGKLSAKNSNVDVYFTSPETNTVWLLLRIIDKTGKVIGQTGIIRPGEYVKTIVLNEVPEKEKNIKRVFSFSL